MNKQTRWRLGIVAIVGVATMASMSLAAAPADLRAEAERLEQTQALLLEAADQLDALEADLAAAVQTIEDRDAEIAVLLARIEELEAQLPSPSPSPSPQPTCTGVQVAAGANLVTVANAQPAGTTFCLAAGTFNIGATPVTAQNGDVFQGTSRFATFIDGNDTAQHLIVPASGAAYTVRELDASGAQGDPACHPACGRAFRSGAGVVLESVECHDNSNQCVGGGGSATLRDVHCFENSEEYSWRDAESGACVKVVRGGSLLVEDSLIEGNNWNGLWCDFCDGNDSSFVVRDSIIRDNGYKGLSYEVSGANGAFGLIENNVITGNGWRYAINGTPNNRPAGITCNDCRDLEIRFNIFGNQALDGLGQRRAVSLLDTDRAEPQYGYQGLPGVFIHDNDLNGDVIVGCSLSGVTCSGNTP